MLLVFWNRNQLPRQLQLSIAVKVCSFYCCATSRGLVMD